MHTCTNTCSYVYVRRPTYRYALMHTYDFLTAYIIQIRTYIHNVHKAYACMLTHIHIHSLIRSLYRYKHSCIHSHMHTNTWKHKYTHTHAHPQTCTLIKLNHRVFKTSSVAISVAVSVTVSNGYRGFCLSSMALTRPSRLCISFNNRPFVFVCLSISLINTSIAFSRTSSFS